MKEGTKLGSGLLLAADVSGMEEGATTRFQWQYLTSPEHVSALGLSPPEKRDGVPSPAFGASPQLCSSYPSSSTVKTTAGLEGGTDPANAFLRRANALLLSLLTPTQKLDFLSNLAKSPSLSPFLSDASRSELDETIRSLSAEVLGGVQAPRATKPLPRRADSAPISSTTYGAENDVSATRLSVAAPAGPRRPSPLSVETASDGGSLHLRPASIRSPSRPSSTRPSSPRKSPLSDSFVQVEGEEDGAAAAGTEQTSQGQGSEGKQG
jgi:hypothetical protein